MIVQEKLLSLIVEAQEAVQAELNISVTQCVELRPRVSGISIPIVWGNPWFAPHFPVVFVIAVFFGKYSTQPPCLRLSELSSSFLIDLFAIPVVFVKATHLQTISLANHRFRNVRLEEKVDAYQ